MKLTRKQLNEMTLLLPHPSLVLEGRINGKYAFPVYKAGPLTDELSYDKIKPKQVIFKYSHEEMDWVLEDFDI